jgi:hypothetical protein
LHSKRRQRIADADPAIQWTDANIAPLIKEKKKWKIFPKMP